MSWVKINKKRNNLPKEECDCWVAVRNDKTKETHVAMSSSNTIGFYGAWSQWTHTITHYWIIDKPKKP